MNLQGTYVDIVEIGSGGGGTVFRAFHTRMQKYVVLKKIHDTIQNNIDIRGELDILKNLRHSYLPTVLDFIQDNGSIYTVMDYIPGESFESLLNRGVRFSQAQVVKYAKQLGEVLCYLHEQNPPIIHGDIKPANIMLTPEDNICLIDFNISQVQNGGFSPNIGYTAGFASPEQVRIVEGMRQYYAMMGTGATNMPVGGNMQNYVGGSTVLLGAEGSGGGQTVLLGADNGTAGGSGTVLLNAPQNSNGTMLLNATGSMPQAQGYNANPAYGINQGYGVNPAYNPNQGYNYTSYFPTETMDVRSDIYSVGATLYALLCGECPSGDFSKIVPIEDKVGNCTEGLCQLINKCIRVRKEDRFQNAADYLKAVTGIAKVDKRYRHLVLRQELAIIFCIIGMAGCVILSILGKEQIGKEQMGAYMDLVAEMEEIRIEGGSIEDFEELYEEAVESFPQYADAYYQKTMLLYGNRQYEEMIEFVSETALDNTYEYSEEEIGKFYFLLANGYLESGDAETALIYYKTAVEYDSTDSTYYSDYAIALARLGKLEEAEKILEQAVSMGLANDKVLLAQGEIYGKQGMVEQAAQCFAECVEETEDEYVLLRAYVMWSKLYDNGETSLESLLEKESILADATTNVAENYKIVIIEQLAQVYIDLGTLSADNTYYEKAISELEKVISSGWDTYLTHNNIGVLYEQMGQYDLAAQKFNEMLSEYGEDYRTYKRLAFLEIDIQAEKENQARDYNQFLAYYNHAKALYADSVAQSDADMEMQLLEQVYQQLVDGNWF
ncbi:MAG: protein kinase [Lachnospiraceae bacterium]|nr:protein kinase [Lachnospiraceae bacterium]